MGRENAQLRFPSVVKQRLRGPSTELWKTSQTLSILKKLAHPGFPASSTFLSVTFTAGQEINKNTRGALILSGECKPYDFMLTAQLASWNQKALYSEAAEPNPR